MEVGKDQLTARTSADGMLLSIRMAPVLEIVGPMLDAMSAFLSERPDVQRKLRLRVMLAAEEIVVNAVRHGALAPEGPSIGITVRCKASGINTRVIYQGITFDPTKAVADPARRFEMPGGHGLDLVRKIADTFAYCRHGRWNVVALSHRPGRIRS